jgi:hypothetical protein
MTASRCNWSENGSVLLVPDKSYRDPLVRLRRSTRHNACGGRNPSVAPVPFIIQNAILRVMWPFRKKTKQTKVVFNREHIGRELIPIPKRPRSEEEMEWVRQSLSSRKEFAEFRLPQLFAVSKCPLRDLPYSWIRTCRIAELERGVGPSSGMSLI